MDEITLLMVAILGLLIFFMIRNSRKQKRTQEELAEKLHPGADVMTSFGLFATVTAIDDDTNVATLDVGNGVEIKVHRQVLTKVVEDESIEEPAAEEAAPQADKS
jgi:preprotein translocase subunit YajC